MLIVTWSSWILDQSTCKGGVEDEDANQREQGKTQKEPGDQTEGEHGDRITTVTRVTGSLVTMETHSLVTMETRIATRVLLLRITVTMATVVGLAHLLGNRCIAPAKLVTWMVHKVGNHAYKLKRN